MWRARDPKLGRDVAIKVLPAAFSADKERLNVPGVSYDVAADGRFLMLEEDYKQPQTFQLQAIFNWSEEVKRRVPAGSK